MNASSNVAPLLSNFTFKSLLNAKKESSQYTVLPQLGVLKGEMETDNFAATTVPLLESPRNI
jgi:hypothetical protein